jgi:hypothetical protein
MHGVLVGGRNYRIEHPSLYFFVEEVHPGIYAVVVEK